MKKIFSFLIILTVMMGPFAGAEEKQKASSLSSEASGGMTYSPTQGWIKTGSQQMQVGTDSLVYQNKKQAIADAVKQHREKVAQEKADAEAKEKLWQDTKKAEADKLTAQNAAEKPKTLKGKTVSAQKSKLPSGKRRVLVS